MTGVRQTARVCFLFLVWAVAQSSQASAASICDDLWFARNAVFNEAGYCFRSPLGQAVFDNSDCIGARASLDQPAERYVARIKVRERKMGCRVETSRTTVDVPLVDLRLALGVQPIRREREVRCVGYIGLPVPLRASPAETAPIVGFISPGDSILARHDAEGDWVFASQVARPESADVVLGWRPDTPLQCEGRVG